MSWGDDISVFDWLGFDQGMVAVDSLQEGLSANKEWLVKEVRQKEFGIDQIYFSGDFPAIYFKRVKNFDQETMDRIREIHRKIWNQGKVAFLYVEAMNELRIYNCYYRPIHPNDPSQDISAAEMYKIAPTDISNLEELRRVFGRVSIESGQFWQESSYPAKLIQKRVNRTLIENLKYTRKVLNSQFGIQREIIHDLLLRSLFILYLEDRGATDNDFYSRFSPGAHSYYDLLASGLKGTYSLFEKLEESFNGNLSPISAEERKIIRPEHLKWIRECFWDKITIDGQQRLFDWKAFDFKYIPIELLSEIYEEFLGAEEGEVKKSNDGAYYTPHILVEFVLNKVLPWRDDANSPSACRILDPTCGSGIFLVESFKRLIDRWEFHHPHRPIDFEDLKKILQENIFGIEYNAEAIKVTAFSLYLAMLDKLEPKTLWKDKKFPYLIYDPERKGKRALGNNLFRMSSLSDGPFNKINFDLVIGNPPFKEGKLDEESKDYLERKGYPQEKLLAFLDRALVLCPEGRIALVAASKPLLFNQGTKYQRFRAELFQQAHVEEIYNFSILRRTTMRHGGNLFSSAVGPASVVFYRRVAAANADGPLLYCAPKTAFKNNLIDGIAIDQGDIRFLPREECTKPDSKIWKVAMWGAQRDFRLIRRLMDSGPTVGEEIDRRGWANGRGFEITSPADKKNEEIRNYPFIEARRLERYCIHDTSFSSINYRKFRRFGAIEAYKGPHVLIKKGLSNNRICASYTSKDCCFTDAILGISAPVKFQKLLKALTLFFNSGVANYFIFLTSSSWGIERENIMANESFLLPGALFNADDEILNRLSDYYQQIKSLSEEFLNKDYEINELEKEIDGFLCQLLQISPNEKQLIDDFTRYSIDLFIKGEHSIALLKAQPSQIVAYSNTLCHAINNTLRFGGSLRARAKLYQTGQQPLQLIALVFDNDQDSSLVEEINADSDMNRLLEEMERHSYKKHSESIYFRKIIKYYKNEIIYILKPNERRFWAPSTALNDADEIMLEMATS